jgi:hypothetical protein
MAVVLLEPLANAARVDRRIMEGVGPSSNAHLAII